MGQEKRMLDGDDLFMACSAEEICQNVIGKLDIFHLVNLWYHVESNQLINGKVICFGCETIHLRTAEEWIEQSWEGIVLVDNGRARDTYFHKKGTERFRHFCGPCFIEDDTKPKMNWRKLFLQHGIVFPE